MANQLPDIELLPDKSLVSIPVSSGLEQYIVDIATKTFYVKEFIIIPQPHAQTHITSDQIPEVTDTTHGLLSTDDKIKLENSIQTTIGILKYFGSGVIEDKQVGDIIFASDSNTLQLERIGRTIRFNLIQAPNLHPVTVSPIYWIVDESETNLTIRPPNCNGQIPPLNQYGELHLFLLPSTLKIDPLQPTAWTSKQGPTAYAPTVKFTRTLDSNSKSIDGQADLEIILKKTVTFDSNGNETVTNKTGWVMSNYPTAKALWYTSIDKAQNQTTFEMSMTNSLGYLLFNGNSVTKQMAIIIGVSDTTQNTYNVQNWDVQNQKVIGSIYQAKNIWQYTNPTTTPLILNDSTYALLKPGTLVDIMMFNTMLGSQYYFSKDPQPASFWATESCVQFGDAYKVYQDIATSIQTIDNWGITQIEDLLLSDDYMMGAEEYTYEPSGIPINNTVVVKSDSTLPAIEVVNQIRKVDIDLNGDGVVDYLDLDIIMRSFGKTSNESDFDPRADLNKDGVVDYKDLSLFGEFFSIQNDNTADRPIFIWDRKTHKNFLMKLQIGQPVSQDKIVPPYDMILSGPIDRVGDKYVNVIRRGVFQTGPFAGLHYVVVRGGYWKDCPKDGYVRILSGIFRNFVWRYFYKTAFSFYDSNCITLIGDSMFPFDDDFKIEPYSEGTGSGGSGGSGGSTGPITLSPCTQTYANLVTIKVSNSSGYYKCVTLYLKPYGVGDPPFWVRDQSLVNADKCNSGLTYA